MKNNLSKSNAYLDRQVPDEMYHEYFTDSLKVSNNAFVSQVTAIENSEFDGNIYNHLHYEWIKFYSEQQISTKQDIENEILTTLSAVDISNDIVELINNINAIYKTYLDEIETYHNAVMPSPGSLRNTLKYVPFLIYYNTNFYIDASTGYLGCSIRKRKSSKKRKNLNLVFKNNDEIIFNLTERMNNIITLSGIADLDDNLDDAQALKYILEM